MTYQKKKVGICTPYNVYNPQNWNDLLERTFKVNSYNKQIHDGREKENLKCTLRTMHPELQPEVDNKHNTITGCTKNRHPMMGLQTFSLREVCKY